MRQRNLGSAGGGVGRMLALAAASVLCLAGAANAQNSQIFTLTGDVQLFVVPAGVTEIAIEAIGASGATVISDPPPPDDPPDGRAGLGGVSIGTLAVVPGETLHVYVGGAGCVPPIGGITCGFNGGGEAGGFQRGGGGGASDVRRAPGTLDDRVIVAAGGGGACESRDFPGGDGGGLVGEDAPSMQVGFGGTQTAGGIGFGGGFTCGSGSFGLGGDAISTCGGGGGGWYGGGSGCGGGGGSSYIGGVSDGFTAAGAGPSDGLVFFVWGPGSPDVAIDIRPGGTENLINTNVADKIDVAILGSASFDVNDIDLNSLAFGPAAAAPFLWAGTTVGDTDADSFDDLVVFFRQEESGIEEGDTQACVTGELTDATPFQGCDGITALACGIGFELAFLLPPIAWLRARRKRR